jgi:Tfp pilus assembly protein PilF
MYTKNKLALFGVLAALSPYHAAAQNQDAASKILIERAQYWQAKGDLVRAAEAYKKLLLIDPKDTKALNGLASLEQDTAIKSDPKKRESLESARSLAKAGDTENAIAKYNAALGGKGPISETLSLEYYSNLGYTAQGFAAAKDGLQKLQKDSPNDPRISLALGKLLINESNTRVEGVQTLSRIATNPKVGSEASENWKKGLLWIEVPNQKEQPLFEAYLKVYPDDIQVREKLDAGLKQSQMLNAARKNPAQDSRAIAAYDSAKKAMANGDELMARAELERSLSIDSNNPWARLDLARLELKSGQSKQAQDLMFNYPYKEQNQPEALYAGALFAVDLKNWNYALDLLDRIPQRNRTPQIIALQKNTWLQSQAANARNLNLQGRRSQALAVLSDAEMKMGNSPESVSILADAYVDVGDPARGLYLIKQQIQPGKQPSPDLQLQYAGILLKTNQDAECANVLRQLNNQRLTGDTLTKFNDLLFSYSLRQVDLLRQRGDLAAAYERLAPLLNQRPMDLSANAALARLYITAGENKKALGVYKQLVNNNPNNFEIKLSAVQVATQIQDYDYANTLLESMLAQSPNNPQLLAAAAKIYQDQGKLTKATALYERALANETDVYYGQVAGITPPVAGAVLSNNPFAGLNNVNGIETIRTQRQIASAPINQATVPDAYLRQGNNLSVNNQSGSIDRIPPPAAYASTPAARNMGSTYANPNVTGNYLPANSSFINAGNATPNPASQYSNTLGSTEVTPRTIITELNEIKQARSAEILLGAQARNRNGNAGTSQLTDIETPLEIRMPVSDGKAIVQITPVSLNAGTLGTDYYSSSTFGGGPAAANAQARGLTAANSSQTASGVGMAAGYTTKNLSIDAGTTPVGFTYTNFTGGIKVNGPIDEANTLSYLVNVSSRPVTDSLLSFAGTKDSRTGQTWGGVMSTGGRVQLTKDLGGYGIYGAGSYYSINGTNVESNTRSEFNGGAYVSLIQKPDSKLTSGLNLNNVYYQKNLSNFTYGQGGYFSPQQYFAATIPVTWSQRSEKLSYQLKGAVGVQQYNQNASNYFPTSSQLQSQANTAQANAQTAGLTGTNQAVYPSQSTTSGLYSLAANAEYQMAPKLFFGGSAQADNSSNYRQIGGGIYLRYSFEPITELPSLEKKPYMSPYGQ